MNDLLDHKRTHFVLWRPGHTDPPPALAIAALADEAPTAYQAIPLTRVNGQEDLWAVPAAECDLQDGHVYRYWFVVRAVDPYTGADQVLLCTDPLAWTVDRRFLAPAPHEGGGPASGQPAAVVLYRDRQLVPCDPGGQVVEWTDDAPLDTRPPNNRLVIYELPTRWSHARGVGAARIGNGVFRDVVALLEPSGDTEVPDLPVYGGRAHLQALGINALELLPPADSNDQLGWGYSTANYLSADYYLGHPDPAAAPTASTDLAAVIRACHRHGMRFFCDMVMAFANDCPYRISTYLDFFVQAGSGDPEEAGREGFGGDLWKYNYWVEGYDPLSGARTSIVPARQFMKTYVAHWMTYYRLDGLRLDSVNNIANEDFVQEFRDLAHALWQERDGAPDKFLVVGEDLGMPMDLIAQHRLDGLWNEPFKRRARQVILGRAADGDESLEVSVRKAIDCRELGFPDGAAAVNYLTSHDIGGPGNERLADWLANNGIIQLEERIKLAFTLLLTAVGIPMILAGDEFVQRQDLDIDQPGMGDRNKQIDPINFGLMEDEWRQAVFVHVARLIHLRAGADALSVNDTTFIHADADEKQVIAWQRGEAGMDPVVVVANFSDYATPDGDDYEVANWPALPSGRHWREVTEDRAVADEWAGREPIRPWAAFVYALA